MENTRKNPRYCCSGSADLSTGETGRVWGHLGDISRSGFYLSTFGPWPLNTEVRFQLEIEGQKVSGTGTVATSHPGVGMAVVFQQLSPEDQEVLNKIVQDIESKNTTADGIGLTI